MIQFIRRKWKPDGKKMLGFLVILLVLDLLLLSYITRKPICLEGELFDQVEWVSSGGEIVKAYNCKANIKVPLSKVFLEKMPEIQKRVNQLEGLLRLNFPSSVPLLLSIHEGTYQNLLVSGDKISVSENVFFHRESVLERAYLKAWLQQFEKSSHLNIFRLEVLTHFLALNLDLQKSLYNEWWPVLSQWPQMATSWSGYCQSPVKDEAHSSLCLQPAFSRKAELFTPFSLSFWFGEALRQSFQVLSVAEQMKFFKNFGPFIKTLSEKSASSEQSLAPSSLKDLEQFTLSEAQIWKEGLSSVQFGAWGWNFYDKVSEDLESYHSSLGRVDLLVRKDSAWTSEELQRLQELSLSEVNYRVVSENPEGLRSFPWLAPVRREAIPDLRAQNFVWITCDWPLVSDLLNSAPSKKVIVVKDCSEVPKSLIFSGLLHRGLQFFSLDNKDSQFVVVNLDSLKYLASKFPEILKMRLVDRAYDKNLKHYLSSKASWVSALWNQQYRAYQVQATIDVIEWFKLPDNTWPDLQ